MLEDNSDDAELLEFELQEAGFDYVSRRVMTEEDFLCELREFLPDIILSDYDLPAYSGAKALAAARIFCPDVPFILVTGAISEDRAIDTLTSGAKDYVMKTRLHRLAPAIKRALAEAEEHKARRRAEEDLRIAHRELEKQVAERTSELQESRERLSLALASSKMGIFEWDIIKSKRYWDSNMHAILGTSPEHFTGTAADFFEVIHPEDRVAAQENFKKAINHDDDYDTDYRVVWPDGSVHFIATRGKVYHDHSGRPVKIIGVSWDITECKRAEEALRESERRERERAMELAALLDAVPMPVFIAHDPDCLDLTGNRAANDFIKISKDEDEDTSPAASAKIPPGHFKAFKDGRKLDIEELPIQRAARGVKVQDFEYSLVMEDGTTRHVLGYGTPLLDAQGSPRGAVQALVDITDRKQFEEKLREANARTAAILTGIADVFYSLDDKWRFTVVNPVAERELFGQPADKLKNKVIWDVFPSLVGTRMQQHYLDAVEKNEMGHFETQSLLNGRWYEAFMWPQQGGLDVYLRNIDKRKQAEKKMMEALQDAESCRSQLEAVFAAQNDAVLIYDTATIVQKANKAFIDIYGFDPTGLNLRNIIDQVSARRLSGEPLFPEDRLPTLHALKGEGVTGFRFLVKNAAGTDLAIEISSGPIKKGDQITGAVAVWHDITEQVKSETALKKSETSSIRENRQLYETGDRYEAKMIGKDKSSLVNTSPVLDESSRFAGTPGKITYITKHKQAEDVISELTQRMNYHVHNSPLAIIEWGPDLRIIRWSGEAELIFGWRADEVLGKRMEDFRWIYKDNAAAFSKELQERTDSRRFFVNRNYRKDGSIICCEWYNSSMLDNTGNLTSILSLVRDVTRRREAEMALADQALKLQERTAQLEEINKELENFGYSVSHDLRAPLRAIEGYARMIIKRHGDKFDNDTLVKFNVIKSSAATMEQIIDALLEFSRLGRQALNVTEVDMAGLVMNVWQDLQGSNPDRNMTLKLGTLFSCRGDKNLLRQVYANLLANAVKFTRDREKTQIEAASYIEEDEHIYYVRDNGAGFDMEYRDKLFSMFRRLHRADEFEGTGIGLATVARIIHKHGGRVWAEGKVNEGATFYFMLP